MTTIVVGLIVVARASGPGPTLIVTSARPGQPPRDLHARPDRPRHPWAGADVAATQRRPATIRHPSRHL